MIRSVRSRGGTTSASVSSPVASRSATKPGGGGLAMLAFQFMLVQLADRDVLPEDGCVLAAGQQVGVIYAFYCHEVIASPSSARARASRPRTAWGVVCRMPAISA